MSHFVILVGLMPDLNGDKEWGQFWTVSLIAVQVFTLNLAVRH